MSDEFKKHAPAKTPKGQENQLISLAFEAAEKQLREGTASSQVITHFLKLGTERERLEREKLEQENLLIREKISSLRSSATSEELYQNAIEAMKRYGGVE